MPCSEDRRAAVPPAFHIRPARGWLNDPNGVVRWRGRWHVFFQHNPDAAVHERIHWGHVSSADLVTWREHPVAFGPQPAGPDRFGCWSGVFVPGLDRPAVAYSGLVDASLESTVCLRYGSADLDAWGEPLVVAGTPRGVGVRIMRDPFVFWYAGRRWALLGAGMDDRRPGILLFSCDDVQAWRFERVWLTADDRLAREARPADVWECPQLVWVDGVAVLVVSLHEGGVLHHAVALVGSVTEVGRGPAWCTQQVVRIDLGPAFYAPQLVQDGPNPLMIGWIRQDGVADGADAVAGCLSFPRRLRMRSGRLEVYLEAEVQSLRRPGAHDAGPSALELPGAAVVEVVRAPAGGQWGVVHGADGAISLSGGLGSQLWVDGEVAELYPGDAGMPSSVRHVGTSPWRLDLAGGTRARIDELARPD